MTKPLVAIDADDTIFDENNAIRLYMHDTYGFTHTEADYLVPGPFKTYFEKIWGLNPQETSKRYNDFVVSTYKSG